MKWLDIPPVWLALALAAAWLLQPAQPAGTVGTAIGWALIGLGLGLMLWAVIEMGRARTTPIPHMQPSALVTSGPFAVTRNPIYLGDALVLLGAIVIWGAWLALPVLGAFVWWIDRHFISAEEERLRAGFGDAFADWSSRVRRWL